MSPYSGASASVRLIDPYHVWHSGPIFSQVTSTTCPARIVATSGQVGKDVNGNLIQDPVAQIEQAFLNLHKVLAAAGARVQDIFKLVWYVVDHDPNNRLYRAPLIKFLNGHRPATTLVPVPTLDSPGFIFEVEAYAAVEQCPIQKVDVVVVGAGLSGLKAAYDIQKAGYSCLVVEARDRVGGKTWSVDPLGNGNYIDLGAAWFNDTNQSYVHELVMSLGLSMVEQYTIGSVIQEDLGGGLSTFAYGTTPSALAEAGGAENISSILNLTETICQNIDIHNHLGTETDLDKYTLEAWARKEGAGESALAAVRVWTRAMLGVEPSELSALYFMDYCKSGGGLIRMRSDKRDGGQHFRLTQGTQSISKGLAHLLASGSVILNSPARSIEQLPEGVLVSAGRGDILCQRVIVSVPTPLYKEITFSPLLPEAKQALSQSNKLGYQLKVMIVYAEPWWRAGGLCGLMQSFEGPVAVTRDSSVEGKQYSLTCFVPGDSGRKLASGTQKERFDAVLAQIARVFGPFVGGKVPQPLAMAEHEWAKDQWAQGCPCPVSPPGVMTQFGHALRTPHGKVHFVGTETAFEWKGYMDGAIRSGERGAKEVIHMLSRPNI
ncbi:hypothetical protein LTR84_011364 [Exophiala bonariae]|uniref:Amine oxidase n=1 Tax=Exophiala bonariae TaxID=1690606 RepID=A0AAV9MRW3_9EURO|nr:hypothetical protein LTR84_011364 [Exophiala bonariae]